jgi:hypothetical protein
MQAATAGDQYSWALVEADGVTQISTAGISSSMIAIAGPFISQAAALAASLTSGQMTPVVVSSSPSTASWVTTIAGHNSATQTTYPEGGWYVHQIVLNYTAGAVAKSQLFALQLMDSII